MAKNLYRLTEPTDDAPLGTDQVRALAGEIVRAVGDPDMHPSIPMRVARAVEKRLLSPNELEELLDIISAMRKAGQLEKPGAYFVTSVKRLFQRHEIPWYQPRNRPNLGSQHHRSAED